MSIQFIQSKSSSEISSKLCSHYLWPEFMDSLSIWSFAISWIRDDTWLTCWSISSNIPIYSSHSSSKLWWVHPEYESIWSSLNSLARPWIIFTSNGSMHGSLCCPSKLKIFRLTVIFSNVSFIRPLWQLIRAFEVARSDLPKITGIWPRGFVIGSVSRMMKSTGKMNSPTLIRTSLISHLKIFIDLSANWSVTLVGFNSLNSNCWYTE